MRHDGHMHDGIAEHAFLAAASARTDESLRTRMLRSGCKLPSGLHAVAQSRMLQIRRHMTSLKMEKDDPKLSMGVEGG